MQAIFTKWIVGGLLILPAASLAGCDKGPAEKAGEQIDEAGEEVQDELDDATSGGGY